MKDKWKNIDGDLLNRYIEKELDDEELEEFEANLEDNPQAQKDLAVLKLTLDLMNRLPPVEAPEHFLPKVRQKVRRIRIKRQQKENCSMGTTYTFIWVGIVLSILILSYLMMQLASL